MPIEKISAAQFRDALRTSISNRTSSHDVAYGPIRDIVIDPVSTVLEAQNDRIRSVSLLLSLIDPDNFSETDLDNFVYNEGLRRIEGSRATANVTFSVAIVDVAGPDLVVQRGFPLATTADSSTSQSVTFVTTEARTLPAADRASYFNINTQKYELTVPVEATTTGSAGLVGASRIRRPLRPIPNFDSVANTQASVGGRDRETNAQLVSRYLLSILGRDLSTPTGIMKFAKDNYPDVVDARTVFGSDTLLTRSGTDAGAVDLLVLGDQLTTQTDNLEYLGINQLISVSSPPLRTVTSVVDITTATTYIEGTDYEVVRDTSGHAGSNRASEGVRFLSTASSPPTVGNAVAVTYTANSLISNLQTAFEQDDTIVLGRDLLIREAARVSIILEARLRVAAGFNTVTISNAVNSAITTYINALGIGADVERSDLQGVVRRLSGVDNFLIDQLIRSDAPSSADVSISNNEYARLDAADLTVTLI